jgi:hypothetical protein
MCLIRGLPAYQVTRVIGVFVCVSYAHSTGRQFRHTAYVYLITTREAECHYAVYSQGLVQSISMAVFYCGFRHGSFGLG